MSKELFCVCLNPIYAVNWSYLLLLLKSSSGLQVIVTAKMKTFSNQFFFFVTQLWPRISSITNLTTCWFQSSKVSHLWKFQKPLGPFCWRVTSKLRVALLFGCRDIYPYQNFISVNLSESHCGVKHSSRHGSSRAGSTVHQRSSIWHWYCSSKWTLLPVS